MSRTNSFSNMFLCIMVVYVLNKKRTAWLSVMTAEPADDSLTYYFSKLIGCKVQDGPVHGVGDLARFSHFKTTF